MKLRQTKNSYILSIIAFIVIITTGLVLFCGLPERLWYRWHSIEQPLLDTPAISAETEFEVYSLGDSVVQVTVRNNSDTSYEYIAHLTHAEQLRDGQWMYWGETPIEQRAHDLVYHEISPGGTMACEVYLDDWFPTPLESGKYRIWLAYAPAEAPEESSNTAGQVCAYFSVEESTT